MNLSVSAVSTTAIMTTMTAMIGVGTSIPDTVSNAVTARSRPDLPRLKKDETDDCGNRNQHEQPNGQFAHSKSSPISRGNPRNAKVG